MGVAIRSIAKKRWKLLGGVCLFGGGLVWVCADRLIAFAYERFRPRLEKELSVPLGHPLKLGNYRGLRFWGFAIGPTELSPAKNDKSTASFSKVRLGFAPISSIRNFRPVASIGLYGTRLSLKSNEKGTYWLFPPLEDELPKADLLVKVVEPALVKLEPDNIDLKAIGRVAFQFAKETARGSFQFGLPHGGRVLLQGRGRFDRKEIRARALVDKVNLESFQSLFPSLTLPSKTQGELGGDLQVSFKKGKIGCRGRMALTGLNLQGGNFKNSLSSSKATIRCRGDHAKLKMRQWSYGPWSASVEGDVLLGNPNNIDVALSGFVGLKKTKSLDLKFDLGFPLLVNTSEIKVGDLEADLNLGPSPLIHFSELIGTEVGGVVTASGQLRGPLFNLRPNIAIRVDNPQVNGLRIPEDWQGALTESPQGDGSLLTMNSVESGIPGKLTARFDRNWLPWEVKISRGNGLASLVSNSVDYIWEADRFKLDGLEVSFPPMQEYERIYGQLSGKGRVAFKNLRVSGEFNVSTPRIIGLQLRQANLQGTYFENEYKIDGTLSPPDAGEISFSTFGRVGGALEARAEARGLSPRWLIFSGLQFPSLNEAVVTSTGTASDLGKIFINTFSGSLDDQLQALSSSKLSLGKQLGQTSKDEMIDPKNLRGEIDADIDLKGPEISRLNLAFDIRGHLWMNGQDRSRALKGRPFHATLSGPLYGGEGQFSILSLPFSLLSLVAPIPDALKGSFGLTSGRYKFGEGQPEVTADLIMDDASIANTLLIVERGNVRLKQSVWELDIAIRSASSQEPLILFGEIPLDPSAKIDVKVESHGDGLLFLSGLTAGDVNWKDGESDLRLYLRGTRLAPQLNGYFDVRDAAFDVYDQTVEDLDSNVIFDFDRLEVQRLKARIGSKGTVTGKGNIALLSPLVEQEPLSVELTEVRLKLPVADVEVGGNMIIKGAVLRPQIGGELAINDGSISPSPPGFVRASAIDNLEKNTVGNSVESRSEPLVMWPEQQWDFKEPLVWLGKDVEGRTSKMLRASIPKLSSIGFNDLKLRLGPDLHITSPSVAGFRAADFRTEGYIKLNGSLDKSLQPSGVLRLLSGRVNAFTTTFNLVRSAPNVAVFTPSLGLVPYLDVAMFSRMSESLTDVANVSSSRVFTTNGSGGLGVGGFRTVKVVVKATGPADRLSENFELSSSPPMPRSQLLELIGGNSLSGLAGGVGGEALTNVLGKGILSPFLGPITDSFSERLQVAVYPTYVSPEVVDESNSTDKRRESELENQESASGEGSPQQAWVTEVGFDVTERLNFSVIATPNRRDIPPQGSLTYQFNPNFGVAGALDNEGKWQSQVQVFFRF